MFRLLRIPSQRVPVLLGKKGHVKKRIETRTMTRILVSKEGDVEVEGQPEGLLTAENVIKAIGRGFGNV